MSDHYAKINFMKPQFDVENKAAFNELYPVV
jgi:hypothetical protein